MDMSEARKIVSDARRSLAAAERPIVGSGASIASIIRTAYEYAGDPDPVCDQMASEALRNLQKLSEQIRVAEQQAKECLADITRAAKRVEESETQRRTQAARLKI